MSEGRAARFDWRLLAGPLVLLAGLALLKLSDVLVVIGPLDRAQFGWLVAFPMIVAAPGLVGVAAAWSGVRGARWTAVGMGATFGLLVGIAWFASTKQVGCNQYPDSVQVLFASLPVPLVLGIGWTAAGWFAIRHADRPWLALGAGIAGAILAGVAMIVTFALFFPALSCAYVPPPA